MTVHLVFLFLFQSGLAFAFAYFIAGILLKGDSDSESRRVLEGMCKIRNIIALISVIIPPSMFIAYYYSLPGEQSIAVAIWPSVWIFMILLALVLALTVAIKKHRKHPGRA